MIDNQYYPTPYSLARKLWDLVDGHPGEVLEPQAGRGALLDDFTGKFKHVDCVEIDLDNASILRSKNYNVIGHDFLTFKTAKRYELVILNPPFSNAVNHVLHAWDNILVEGQLVAIVNAESIRNPNDKYRRRLVELLDDDTASVEFVKDAFITVDTQRKTNVEVALISLKKSRDITIDYGFLNDLTKNDFPTETKDQTHVDAGGHSTHNQIAIPQSVVARAVTVYNAACTALARECDLTATLRKTTHYYFNLLAESIVKPVEETEQGDDPKSSKHCPLNTIRPPTDRDSYNTRLSELRERAWSTVLAETEIGKKLSTEVVKDLTQRFSEVSSLEFTESNILSFLSGLAGQLGDMQTAMLQQCHRELTCYGHGNQVYYKGWKSNDKHRVAFRIKTTRIVLPLTRSSFSTTLYEHDLTKFKDIDHAFDFLSGLAEPQGKLVKAMIDHSKAGSTRFNAGHFDVRMYSSTIHLFPQSQKLVDRLNLWVGRSRNWVPPEVSPSDDKQFWDQYKRAEKFQQELLDSTDSVRVWDILNDRDGNNTEYFNRQLDDAATSQGFEMNFRSLASDTQEQLSIGSQ